MIVAGVLGMNTRIMVVFHVAVHRLRADRGQDDRPRGRDRYADDGEHKNQMGQGAKQPHEGEAKAARSARQG
ncbi:MAG: hypothetical protein ACJ8DU_23960 [Microvirga sp.]|jgi:hypothetical protein|nr:hypothetical protein [Beijerinckiaceae bacterium]